MAGQFITFEGLDGSGKSTHLQSLGALLEAAAIDHLVTHEPGGTAIGAALRTAFLSRDLRPEDGTVEALLVFADRRQHLLEMIEPALAAGTHVLCDRFTDSTIAYQGHGRGASLEVLGDLDRLATGARLPDRTLLFDLPAEIARRRSSPDGKDRLDAEDLAFHERVRMGYLELAGRYPDRFRVIDSARPKEETEDQVRAALTDLLGV